MNKTLKTLMMLFKVEVGSAMYKKGVRWIEYSESEGIGKHDTKHMVLDYIITISTTIDHPYKYRYIDYNHHLSGARSHELQREHPEGKQHVPTQYG